jgi:hypothetical protein
LHPLLAGRAASRGLFVFIDNALRRIAIGLGQPAAFQPAVAIEPMTGERGGWNPALAPWAAKTQQVVIGMHGFSQPGRHAPWLKKPEFCESFEHRSPPFPLCAAGQ